MVLADEGLNGKIVAGLRKQNIEVTIVFLRYEKDDYAKVFDFLSKLIKSLLKAGKSSKHEFITINKNKVRRRFI
mgnify:CR=1 FL=1|jgi:hypothetical protein